MNNLTCVLNKYLENILKTNFPDSRPEILDNIHFSVGYNHDLQFSSVNRLAKMLSVVPDDLAEIIIQSLSKKEFINKIEKIITKSNGNIVIAIDIKPTVYLEFLNGIYKHLQNPVLPKNGQKVLVDYSSPNIAKEMHVGHLRSTIIGGALCRLYEYFGYEVLRVNHLGDWGTQFGMLIAYMKKFNCDMENYTISDLMNYYKKAKTEFDNDVTFSTEAHNETVKLQRKDPENIKIWEKICEISKQSLDQIYAQLNEKLVYRGESFYQDQMVELVEYLKQNNKVLHEKGMYVMFPIGHRTPFIIQKSDGGFTYDTSDLAALRYRVDQEGVNKIIYVVDSGQSNHFEQLFKLADTLGFSKNTVLEHVAFGVVLGDDGTKLKTRSGDTPKLQDLLDSAYENSKTMTANLMRERKIDLPEEEINTIAQTIAINSIKYADLSNLRETSYKFSTTRMLESKGDTGVYILYGYARCCSILRNIEQNDLNAIIQNDIEMPENKFEWTLVKTLLELPEALSNALAKSAPHYICKQMYKLVTDFSSFYKQNKCVDIQEERVVGYHTNRIKLVYLVKLQLSFCMHLVGMKCIEQI